VTGPPGRLQHARDAGPGCVVAGHRALRRPRRGRRISIALASVMLLGGVVWWVGRGEPATDETGRAPAAAGTTSAPAGAEEVVWGPTAIERRAAKILAAELSLEELAGQL